MADVKAVVDFVLRQEDSTLSGTITNDPSDRGGDDAVRSVREMGIPNYPRRGFFLPSTSPHGGVGDGRGCLYLGILLATPPWEDNELGSGKRRFSRFSVLEGVCEAVSILQKRDPCVWRTRLRWTAHMGPGHSGGVEFRAMPKS